MRELNVRRLGRIGYAQALVLQEQLHEARVAGRIDDTLLLLEHEPVITWGRAGKKEHLQTPGELLQGLGIELHDTGRGGDVTFHGPGQLVAYPIVDLKPDRCDVRRYIRDLEETMIRTASDLGLEAERREGLNGAWIGERKLGSVGVRISRWVTMHGVALNVGTDLSYFRHIVPCGIANCEMTSLSRELGYAVALPAIEDSFAMHFAEIFDAHLTDDSAGASV